MSDVKAMSKESKQSKLKAIKDAKELQIRDDFDKELAKVKAEDQQIFLLAEIVKELKILNSNY